MFAAGSKESKQQQGASIATDNKDQKDSKKEVKTDITVQPIEKRNAAVQAVCNWSASITSLVASYASPVDHLYDSVDERKHNGVEELKLTNDELAYIKAQLLPLLYEYIPNQAYQVKTEVKLTPDQINSLRDNHILLAGYFVPHQQWDEFCHDEKKEEKFGQYAKGGQKFREALQLVLDSQEVMDSYLRPLRFNVEILLGLHHLSVLSSEVNVALHGRASAIKGALTYSKHINWCLTINLFHLKLTDQDLQSLFFGGNLMGCSPYLTPALQQKFINFIKDSYELNRFDYHTGAEELYKTWMQLSEKTGYTVFGSSKKVNVEDYLALFWILGAQTMDELLERSKAVVIRKETPVSDSFKKMLNQFVKKHSDNEPTSSSSCLMM